MNAGDLNHVIRIDRRIETQDAAGQAVVTWQPFLDNMPARVAPLSAREFLAGQASATETDVLVQFWWVPGITNDMRVVDTGEGVTYNITGVLPDNVNGRSWITLACKAGLTDGA
jgi:SPP1 family predicted phage head-tail adaptor